ncbi:hypothetical protein JZI27_10970 [Brevibacillus sp. AY1]|nr:hypothetical protein [Brevibacillus sp. AY1]
MDVEVYYEGQRREAVPYSALPALHLFCRQYGFQFHWDPKQKRIDLDSGLKGKVCLLVAGGAEEGGGLEHEVLSLVETFLSSFGAHVLVQHKKTRLPAASDSALRFTVKELRALDEPRLILFQGENERRRALLNHVFQELKQTGVSCHIRMSKQEKTSSILPVQLHIPLQFGPSEKQDLVEKIAFFLASGVLCFFQAGQQINPISYLPSHIVQALFGNTPLLGKEPAAQPHEGTSQSEEITEPEVVPEAQDMDTSTFNVVTEPEQVPEPSETPVSEEAPEISTESEVHATKESPSPSPQQKDPVLQERAVPLETEKRLEAEVYFDYTLMHSDTEDRPYLLIGSLFVKNTGTELLYNPIVCLRVSPLNGIRLGGQILPPNMLETLGVQSSAGIKGWKYLDDDWFSQAQERGEYWIAPIQPMMIPPKMNESFQNFQISLLKQETRTSLTVEGMVLFNDQQVHFMTNNRIAVSF